MATQEEMREISDGMMDPKASLSAESITFGCEIECLLTFYRDPEDAHKFPRSGYPSWGKKVIRRALSKPFPVVCADPNCSKLHLHPLKLSMEDEDYYDKWQVGEDFSIALRREDQSKTLGKHSGSFVTYPMEIKSRILRFGGPAKCDGTNHVITWRQELTAVFDRLYEEFHLGRDPKEGPYGNKEHYHLLITPDCGFHVHIAAGRNSPIPWTALKKLYSIFVACERQIDGLHGRSRINGSFIGTEPLEETDPTKPWNPSLLMDREMHNNPPSSFLIVSACARRQYERLSIPDRLEKDSLQYLFPDDSLTGTSPFDQVKFGLDIDSWLTLVNQAGSPQELEGLCHNKGVFCTINLGNLPVRPPTEDPDVKRCTIEFRQHVGTLKAGTALSWIDFLVNLVLRSHSLEDAELSALIGPNGDLRRPAFSPLKLCKFVGCSEETILHYSRRRKPQTFSKATDLDKELCDALVASQDDAPEMKIAKLALEYNQWQHHDLHPIAVEQRVFQKLAVGGYGQFREQELRAYFPGADGEMIQRLCLGYQGPLFKTDAPTKYQPTQMSRLAIHLKGEPRISKERARSKDGTGFQDEYTAPPDLTFAGRTRHLLAKPSSSSGSRKEKDPTPSSGQSHARHRREESRGRLRRRHEEPTVNVR